MRVAHLARKSISETNVGQNVLVHGTGGINLDASRIESEADYLNAKTSVLYSRNMAYMGSLQTRPWVQRAIAEGRPTKVSGPHPEGRWPSNVLVLHQSECQPVETGIWICVAGCSAEALTAAEGNPRYFKQLRSET